MKTMVYANGMFMVNTYLIINSETNEGIVIDPGAQLDNLIQDIDEQKTTLKAIICTHGHIDHIEGVAQLQNDYSIPFYISDMDATTVEQTQLFASLFGVPAPTIPKIDKQLPSEGTITIANLDLQLFHTPGHSPGSISILIEDNLFVGDVLFNGSIGRTDLPGGNHQQLVESIQDTLYILNDDIKVFPGHGPATTISKEKNTNPFVKKKEI